MNLLFSFDKMFPIPKKGKVGNLIISEKSSLAVPGMVPTLDFDMYYSTMIFNKNYFTLLYSFVKLTYFNYLYLSFRIFFLQIF